MQSTDPVTNQAKCVANAAMENGRQKHLNQKTTEVDLTMMAAPASIGRMKTMWINFLIPEIDMVMT